MADISNLDSEIQGVESSIKNLEEALKNLTKSINNIQFNAAVNQLKDLNSQIANTGSTAEKTQRPVDILVQDIDAFIDVTKKMKDIKEGIQFITSLGNALEVTNTATRAVTTSMSGIGGALSTASAVTKTASESMVGIGAATGAATTSTGALSTAMAAISGPAGIATLAVMGVTLAVLSCLEGTSTLTDEQEEQIAKYSEMAQKNSEIADTQRDLNNSFKEAAENIKGDYLVANDYFEKLLELSGEDGYLSNLSTAEFYVTRLRDMGLEGISITEDGKLKLEETVETYKDIIDQLEIKAMLEASEKSYGQALLDRQKLLPEATAAQAELNTKHKDFYEILQEELAAGKSYDVALSAAIHSDQELTKGKFAVQEALAETNRGLAESEDAIKDHDALLRLQSGSAKEQGEAMIDLALAYDEVVGAGGEMTYTWDGMMTQMANYKGDVEKLSETERASKDYLKQCMLEKGIATTMTLDEIKAKMGETYTSMSEQERSAFDSQYYALLNSGDEKSAELIMQKQKFMDILAQKGIEWGSEEARQYQSQFEYAQAAGLEQGEGFLNELTKGVTAEKPQVDVDTTKGKVSVDGLKASSRFNETGKVNADTSGANSSITSAKTNAAFNANANVDVTFTKKTSGIKVGAAGAFVPISFFAKGGFPDAGELFIAREAGPELVGRINGKNAVANNDQIVSGISSGVYQAVRSAMNGYGGNGNFNINATFMMDSEVVGRQVIKYHNGVVKRTGNTPLLV